MLEIFVWKWSWPDLEGRKCDCLKFRKTLSEERWGLEDFRSKDLRTEPLRYKFYSCLLKWLFNEDVSTYKSHPSLLRQPYCKKKTNELCMCWLIGVLIIFFCRQMTKFVARSYFVSWLKILRNFTQYRMHSLSSLGKKFATLYLFLICR